MDHHRTLKLLTETRLNDRTFNRVTHHNYVVVKENLGNIEPFRDYLHKNKI